MLTLKQQLALPSATSLEAPKALAEMARGLLWQHLRTAHKEQQMLLEQGQMLPVRQTQQLSQISRSMDRAREVVDQLTLLLRQHRSNPFPS